MSSMPASAITSASPSFWQVMPWAPASICSFASIGLLWVLMCGRLATPAASHAAWIRAMLRSTRSMSMTATGVPYSRAILAARGVVIESTPVVPSSSLRANGSRECAPDDKLREAIPLAATQEAGLLRRFAPRNDENSHRRLVRLHSLNYLRFDFTGELNVSRYP